ncbi:MAG: PhoH family protein, partial [Blastococcus sp.]
MPDGSASREASARAAAQDAASASTSVPSAAGAPAAVRATITVPASVAMVGLLGSGDELLRMIEGEVAADVHVRGNEITVTGRPADNAFAVQVFDELIALLGTGQSLRPDSVRR